MFAEDIPLWRDLMWHPILMHQKEGNRYEGHVKGIMPDAWLVEVNDTALGFPSYVTSLPQDLTQKETKTRYSQGSVSRHWRLKTEEDIAASAAGDTHRRAEGGQLRSRWSRFLPPRPSFGRVLRKHFLPLNTR